MVSYTMLDCIGVVLILVHFGFPLAYYMYAVRRWLRLPWVNFSSDNGDKPSGNLPLISVIVPTYNEASLIEGKLDNLYMQDYPRNRLELIIIDSGSTDNTVEIVEDWRQQHPESNLKLIVEKERRGKAVALNHALKHVGGDIVVITDVDSRWESTDTLRRVARWFRIPLIGAVSCSKKPSKPGLAGVEEGYRSLYNVLRLAESKAWSTPIYHGELAAFRRELLEKIGGFPTDLGADDSHTATRIALLGYRAIVADDIVCSELVPVEKYGAWRIRRAQHLIQHFARAVRFRGVRPGRFKVVLYSEAFLHLFNPLLLWASVALFIASALTGSFLAIVILLAGIISLAARSFRTWIITQLYLTVALIRNLYTKEIVWEKQSK